MSATVHRSLRRPITRHVEPAGEAHYWVVTTAVTGVGASEASPSKASAGSSARRVLITPEVTHPLVAL